MKSPQLMCSAGKDSFFSKSKEARMSTVFSLDQRSFEVLAMAIRDGKERKGI